MRHWVIHTYLWILFFYQCKLGWVLSIFMTNLMGVDQDDTPIAAPRYAPIHAPIPDNPRQPNTFLTLIIMLVLLILFLGTIYIVPYIWCTKFQNPSPSTYNQSNDYCNFSPPERCTIKSLFGSTNRSNNGLIILGDPHDFAIAKTHFKGENFRYSFKEWKISEDNEKRLCEFIRKCENFRIVIVINEDKLTDDKALYTRDLIQELHQFKGIENYLNYIDILVLERQFKVNVQGNLKALATTRENFKFKRTPHLISNLLFNLKNHSITQVQFFKDIQTKQGLSNHYLSIDNNRLDIKVAMRREAETMLATLPDKLKQKSKKQSQVIISLYYSVHNNEKDKIIELMQKILDERVIIHLGDADLEIMYKERIKKDIEELELDVRASEEDTCVPPDFDRDECEKEFYLEKMKTKKIGKKGKQDEILDL